MNPLSPLTRVLIGAALRAHPGRTVVGVLAIAVGVAMGYAVYLINHAALVEFSQAVRVLSGRADLEVRGPQSGFDEHLYARLARLPGVAAASPVVAAKVSLPGHRETLDVLGVDVFRAMEVSPGLVGRAPHP
jgi:putative ABC transport system permease protein